MRRSVNRLFTLASQSGQGDLRMSQRGVVAALSTRALRGFGRQDQLKGELP